MRLVILASTPQARGDELESLTSKLLEKLGYTEIVRNFISHGGHEIDVRGKRFEELVSNKIETRLVCECKAIADPLGTSDWLKFVGKVFTESITTKANVLGVMIALSGINGNVAGQYEAIRSESNNIELLSGEALLALLHRHFALRPLESVVAEISQLTNRTPTSFEIGYAHEEFAYIVTYADGAVVVVPSNTKTSKEIIQRWTTAIHEERGCTCISLDEEHEFQRSMLDAKKIILCELLRSNGIGNAGQLHSAVATQLSRKMEECESIFVGSIEQLTALDVIKCNGLDVELKALSTRSVDDRIQLLRQIFAEYAVILSPWTPTLDDQIDQELLRKIFDIHELPPVEESVEFELLQILRWSPHALSFAIHEPIRLNPSRTLDQKYEQFRLDHFRQEIFDRFVADFRDGKLQDYFHNVRDIREIEAIKTYTIKSSKEVVFTFLCSERLVVDKNPYSNSGELALMKALPNAPQPWGRNSSE